MVTGVRRSGRTRTQVTSYAEHDLAGAALRETAAARPQPKKKTKQKIKRSSKLLELPPELRNRVYDLVFDARKVKLGKRSDAPGLLLTCKQVFAEAYKLCYAATIFMASHPVFVETELQDLGQSKVCLIKSLHCGHEYVRGVVPSGRRFKERVKGHTENLKKQGIVLDEGVVKVRTRRTGKEYISAEEVEDKDMVDGDLEPGETPINRMFC